MLFRPFSKRACKEYCHQKNYWSIVFSYYRQLLNIHLLYISTHNLHSRLQHTCTCWCTFSLPRKKVYVARLLTQKLHQCIYTRSDLKPYTKKNFPKIHVMKNQKPLALMISSLAPVLFLLLAHKSYAFLTYVQNFPSCP